jgi:hypothetical protein
MRWECYLRRKGFVLINAPITRGRLSYVGTRTAPLLLFMSSEVKHDLQEQGTTKTNIPKRGIFNALSA